MKNCEQRLERERNRSIASESAEDEETNETGMIPIELLTWVYLRVPLIYAPNFGVDHLLMVWALH
jgi:hypothetical protein